MNTKIYLFFLLIGSDISQQYSRSQTPFSCPSGFECATTISAAYQNNMPSSLQKSSMMKACLPGSYSLDGWGRCCSIVASLECGRRHPGHFAFNSSCQCSPVLCIGKMDPMRGNSPGQIICDTPPSFCQSSNNKPCASPSMIREPHTCNCLKILYPCPSGEVLWGDIGGPYQCLAFSAADTNRN